MALIWDKNTKDIRTGTVGEEWLYVGSMGTTPYFVRHDGYFRLRSESRELGRTKVETGVGGNIHVKSGNALITYRSVRFTAPDRERADEKYGTPTAPEGFVSKAEVEAEARRVAREQGWCEDGVQESLRRLGITPATPKREVALDVRVTVEGMSADEARRTVESAAKQALRGFGSAVTDSSVRVAYVQEKRS